MKAQPKNTSEFLRTFQNFIDCFVVIGGTPTLLYIEQREGILPRKTVDLDIVILDIERTNGNSKFLKTFSQYIDENEYECKQLSSGKAQSYRFTNPKNELAPLIIEISTPREAGIPLKRSTQRLEDFEMSSIICESYFIKLLKKHREKIVIEKNTNLALPVAKAALLILMKAFAVDNLKKSENKYDQIKAKKHLNDILRLTRILTDTDEITVSTQAYRHLDTLLMDHKTYFNPARMESCGWKNKTSEEVQDVLRQMIKKERL